MKTFTCKKCGEVVEGLGNLVRHRFQAHREESLAQIRAAAALSPVHLYKKPVVEVSQVVPPPSIKSEEQKPLPPPPSAPRTPSATIEEPSTVVATAPSVLPLGDRKNGNTATPAGKGKAALPVARELTDGQVVVIQPKEFKMTSTLLWQARLAAIKVFHWPKNITPEDFLDTWLYMSFKANGIFLGGFGVEEKSGPVYTEEQVREVAEAAVQEAIHKLSGR